VSQIKIILTIRSFNIGGTERQLLELVKGINKDKFDVTVCAMSRGTLDFKLKEISRINFICLNKKGRYDLLSYYKYVRLIRKFKPHIIYSFLSDSNLISLICSKISLSKCQLVWGIRGSVTNTSNDNYFSKLIFKFQKKFSRLITLVIYNSFSAAKSYVESGFLPKQYAVIQNGFDSKRFYKNIEARNNFRTKYKIKDSDIVIGITSRIDPIKGYPDFCRAALVLLKKYENIYFFSIGYGVREIQLECEKILGSYNEKRFYWLGKQVNPEDYTSGWDIFCSASLPGEGFPNSIAEAMLCELSPVVTDSGDSADIVGDIGLVARCSDASDLKLQLEKMILSPLLIETGIKCRNRILALFSIDEMVRRTEQEMIKILT